MNATLAYFASLPSTDRAAIERRFWSKVDKNGPTQAHMQTPCWLWRGGRFRGAHRELRYGQFSIQHQPSIGAHVFAFAVCAGVIPPGYLVRHQCDVMHCVNPEHLTTGTPQDNMADRQARRREVHGVRCHTAKLSETQAIEIRQRLADGESQTNLAREFQVSQPAVSALVLEKTWKHLLRKE